MEQGESAACHEVMDLLVVGGVNMGCYLGQACYPMTDHDSCSTLLTPC